MLGYFKRTRSPSVIGLITMIKVTETNYEWGTLHHTLLRKIHETMWVIRYINYGLLDATSLYSYKDVDTGTGE